MTGVRPDTHFIFTSWINKLTLQAGEGGGRGDRGDRGDRGISKSHSQARGIHLVGSVRDDEGELVGVLLLLAGVEVLDAAGHQVGLRERADSGACRRANRSFYLPHQQLRREMNLLLLIFKHLANTTTTLSQR